MVLGQREHSEPLGHVLFQPTRQLRGAVAIPGDEIGERGLGLCQIFGGPDRLQLAADALTGLGIGRVVDGVLGEVELRCQVAPPSTALLAARRPA